MLWILQDYEYYFRRRNNWRGVAVRTLYLLRHAKSDSGARGLRDFDRPLAPRGRQAAPRMAAYMRDQGLAPDLVLASAAARARETWELMAPEFGGDTPVVFEDALYLAGPRPLLDRLRRIGDAARVLLIGHNPGLHSLSLQLGIEGEPDALAEMARKYPTAALAEIAFEMDHWDQIARHRGRLMRFVRPRALA